MSGPLRDAYGFPAEGPGSDGGISAGEAQARSEEWMHTALSLIAQLCTSRSRSSPLLRPSLRHSAPCRGSSPVDARTRSPVAPSLAAASPRTRSKSPLGGQMETEEETAAQIESDLPRAMPLSATIRTEAAQSALRRILTRFASEHPQMGYTQSMCDVAAVALLGVTGGRTEGLGGASGMPAERAAYTVLCEISGALGPDFYSPTLTGVQVECRVLESLAQTRLPQVSESLRSGGAMFLPTTARWLMCVFAHDLRPRALFALWDELLRDLHATSRCGSAERPRAEAHAAFLARLHAARLAVLEAVPRVPAVAGLGMIGILRDCPAVACEDPAELAAACARHLAALIEQQDELDALRGRLREEVEEEAERAEAIAVVSQLERETHFSRAELDGLMREFRSIGGRIDERTFRTVLGRAAPAWSRSDLVASSLFAAFDTDHSGELDFREVMLLLSALCRGTLRDKLRAVFQAIDLDRSGSLSKPEFLLLVDASGLFQRLHGRNGTKIIRRAEGLFSSAKTAEEYVDRLFENLDMDRSGSISLVEFERVVVVEPALVRMFFNDDSAACRKNSDVHLVDHSSKERRCSVQ
eukprot:m51a1_g3904 hypothetical protein (585) ;mRNA; r:121612-123548